MREMQARSEEEANGAEDDPREKVEWTFSFDFKDPESGRTYRALFTNRILANDDRLRAATLESQLLGGVAYDSVDPTTGALAKAVAHTTFSLKAKLQQDPPGWADNLLALYTSVPVMALFEEVLDHERTFRGLGPSPSPGEEEG